MLVLIKSKVQPNTGQFWLAFNAMFVENFGWNYFDSPNQYIWPICPARDQITWMKCLLSLVEIKHRREIFLADKAIFNLNQVSIWSGSNLEIIEASKDFAFGSKLGTFASAPLLQNHIFIINILVITIPLQQRSLCYMVASGRTIPGARVFRCKWLWWWSTKFSPWRLKIVLQHSSMVTFDRRALQPGRITKPNAEIILTKLNRVILIMIF